MKTKLPNASTNAAPDAASSALEVWKQMEDVLVPQLRLSVLDRSIYSHLLRHSRLEGKLRLRFSIDWLSRAVRVSGGPVRESVRRLVALGAFRLVERTKAGHLVEVRLPNEIRATGPTRSVPAKPGKSRDRIGVRHSPGAPNLPTSAPPLEDSDFLQTRALRQSIHARERGLCFYCLRRLTPSQKCLDHVVPRVNFGRNSYRNLVSCCVECNSQKSERPVRDFLRSLYRDQRLTNAELADRLRALDALAAGKLRPPITLISAGALPAPACPEPRRESRRVYPTSPKLPKAPRRVNTGSRTLRVPLPPGGPANPFPHKGRPRKSPVAAS